MQPEVERASVTCTVSTPQAEEERWDSHGSWTSNTSQAHPAPGPVQDMARAAGAIYGTITQSLGSLVSDAGKSKVPRVSCLRVRITETPVSVRLEGPRRLVKKRLQTRGVYLASQSTYLPSPLGFELLGVRQYSGICLGRHL